MANCFYEQRFIALNADLFWWLLNVPLNDELLSNADEKFRRMVNLYGEMLRSAAIYMQSV